MGLLSKLNMVLMIVTVFCLRLGSSRGSTSGCDLLSQQEEKNGEKTGLIYRDLWSFYYGIDTRDRACTPYSNYYCITTFLGKSYGSIVLYVVDSFDVMLDVILGLSCGDMGIVQLASKAPF